MLETSQAAIAAPPVASIKLGFLFFFFFLSVILFSAVYSRLEGCTVLSRCNCPLSQATQRNDAGLSSSRTGHFLSLRTGLGMHDTYGE
jgi:hypothetical protein